MRRIDEIIKNKRQMIQKYADFFSSNKLSEDQSPVFFIEPPLSRSNYWLNVILLKDRVQRDEFLKYTNDNGVMTRPVWELMNRLPMFKDCQTGDLSNAQWLADRVVNIPSSVRV